MIYVAVIDLETRERFRFMGTTREVVDNLHYNFPETYGESDLPGILKVLADSGEFEVSSKETDVESSNLLPVDYLTHNQSDPDDEDPTHPEEG